MTTDLGNAGIEDPFLYLDDVGNYHALFHHMYGEGTADRWWLDTCGGHGFSRDGRTWEYGGVAWGSAEHPLGQPVKFTDGIDTSFTRREEPHLVFNANGLPAALTNAAQYGQGREATAKGDNGDASYTMIQPLQQ